MRFFIFYNTNVSLYIRHMFRIKENPDSLSPIKNLTEITFETYLSNGEQFREK